MFKRRDLLLLVVGAAVFHVFSLVFTPYYHPEPTSVLISTHIDHPAVDTNPLPPPPEEFFHNHASNQQSVIQDPIPISAQKADQLPETTIVSHAPGWTIFRDLYMADGTIFIVSSHEPSWFPDIRLMTSTGLPAENTPENIRLREPTNKNMDFMTPEEAMRRWGRIEAGEDNRVYTVEGSTFLINDPGQFLRHYYHFVAELLFGAWSFWTGTFSLPQGATASSQTTPPLNSNVPKIDRFIFANSDADGWRDNPGFNSYFLRAAFPSLTVEHIEDWDDRIKTSRPPQSPKYNYANPDPDPKKTELEKRKGSRVWHFPLVMFADRSAAFRGDACGSRTQRTAAEAIEVMEKKLPSNWWDPLRLAVLKFAGAKENIQSRVSTTSKELPMPEKVVITYINRQKTQRRLRHADHDVLVQSLEEMVQRRGWDLNIVYGENLSKDEQVRIMARTTILLGVHGNGLTHLVLMPRTRISTVIEMFVPHGFAHDYQWTTTALGMKHFAIWNDTHITLPNKPEVAYPDGFQGPDIPVYGPVVTQLIEDRVDGKL